MSTKDYHYGYPYRNSSSESIRSFMTGYYCIRTTSVNRNRVLVTRCV